jgi:hypothetical protein
MSLNSRNQGFYEFFLLVDNYGSVSKRPKNKRIRNTVSNYSVIENRKLKTLPRCLKNYLTGVRL